MARVIEAVQIFKKVEDVTAAKDDPPPVYLMDELAEMARGSFDSSEKIADRIAKRLQNKSPTVKFKALRLTRHVCNKGGGHFKRAMQKHANLVRDLTHYNGEPDPLKGDALNQRVRDAAKEASEALFNTVVQQPVNSLGSRIQGFGSAAAPGTSGTGGSAGGYASAGNTGGSGGADRSSSSRMGGFGNSGTGGGYTAPNIPPSSGSGTGFGNFGGQQRGVNRPLTGGYGDSGGPTLPTTNSGGYSGSGGYGAPTPVLTAGVLGSEEQLVDSICTPAGLRLAPEQEDLRRFVEAVGSLDGLKVAELLRDKMDSSSTWQQLLRALYALEAVLQHGASQACGEIAVMFQSDPAPVQAAAMHPQATVKERANRVLRQLLGDSTGAAAPQAAAAAHARQQAPPPQQQQPGNLVDLLGDSPVKPPQQPQQQPYAGTASLGIATVGSGDMFSGLAVPTGSEMVAQTYQALPTQQQQQPAYHGGAPPLVAAPRPAATPDLLGLDSPLAAPARPAQTVVGPTANGAYPQQGLGGGTGAAMGMGMGMAQVGGQQAGMPPVQPLGGPVQAQSQAQGSQQRNLAVPLDDLFSDMSLSGASHQPAAAGRMVGAAVGPGSGMVAGGYGGYGPAAGGGAGGMAGGYGGMANGGMTAGGGGASYNTLAGGPSGAGTPSAVASGFTTPTMLGSQAMVGSSVGTPTAGSSGHMNQYGGAGALQAGAPGPSGMMQQQQQQQYRQGAMPLAGSSQPGPVGGMLRAGGGGSATDLLGLGGQDVYGASSAPGGGPQMGMNRGGGAGMGMAGGPGMGMGGMGGMGMAAAPGMGMTGGAGMGSGMGMGLATGGGMGMGAGGVMVAPGGQVQYVPQQQQGMGMGMGIGPGGGMGAAAGGGAYGMQQHLGQAMATGSALGGQQGHGRGGSDASAFDFVMDSFVKR